MTRSLAVIALFSLSACAQPSHLQYDYSRAYSASFRTQADLGRASVSKADYRLSGEEGLKLREEVVKQTTDEESGEVEATE